MPNNQFKTVAIITTLSSLAFYFLGLYNLNFDYSINRICSFGVLTDRGLPRLIGVLSHDPNIAMFNVTFLFFLVYFDKNNFKQKYIFVFILITVLLTFSRGGLVGYFTSIILYLLIYSIRNQSNNKARVLKTICIIVVIIFIDYIIFLVNEKSVLITFINRFENSLSGGGSGRIDLWKASLQVAKDNWLLGIGINNSQLTTISTLGHPKYIHNTYIEILTEGGILLLLSFIYFIITYFKGVLTLTNERIKITLSLSMIAMLVQAFFLSLSINEFWFVMIFLLRIENMRRFNGHKD